MVKTKQQVDLLTQLVLSEDAQERAKLAGKLRKMLNNEEDPKITIQSVLRDLGVPCALIGYKYLVRAIEIQMQAEGPMEYTKGLYYNLAKEFGTTFAGVERGMRRCVEISVERCNPDTYLRYFGYAVDANRGKPMLREFICRIAEAVQECRDA